MRSPHRRRWTRKRPAAGRGDNSGWAARPPLGLPRLGRRGRAAGEELPAPEALRRILVPPLLPRGSSALACRPTPTCPRTTAPTRRVMVQAPLAPGADHEAVTRCHTRLVDPAVRRVLAQAPFTKAEVRGAQVTASSTSPSRWKRARMAGSRWCQGPPQPGPPSESAAWCGPRRCAGPMPRCGPSAPRPASPRSPPVQRLAGQPWPQLAWERCRRDWAAAGEPFTVSPGGRPWPASPVARPRSTEPKSSASGPPARK